MHDDAWVFRRLHRCKDVDRRAGCWPGWPLTRCTRCTLVCVLCVLLIVRGPWWIPTWNLCANVPNDARHHANAAPVWRECSEWHKAWALDPKTRYPWNMTHALTEDEHRPRPVPGGVGPGAGDNSRFSWRTPTFFKKRTY